MSQWKWLFCITWLLLSFHVLLKTAIEFLPQSSLHDCRWQEEVDKPHVVEAYLANSYLNIWTWSISMEWSGGGGSETQTLGEVVAQEFNQKCSHWLYKRWRHQQIFNELFHRLFKCWWLCIFMTPQYDLNFLWQSDANIEYKNLNEAPDKRIAHQLFSPFCVFSVQILHHHIASVEKLSLTTTGCPLFIQCRNFRVVHFVVQRERDCHDVYSSLLRLLRPGGFHSACLSKFLTLV